jgi:ferredoxin--NADP+ reductase
MEEPVLNAIVTLRNEVSPWLMILQVVPDGWELPDYLPGHFTSLGLPGSAKRCALAEPEISPADPEKLIKRVYCIASSPANREFLEFYIALVPGGALSPRLFNLKIGDRIWLSPKVNGKFTYDDSQVPEGANLVLMATGSGLAPFISMLSTYLSSQPKRRVAIIHGARHSWDLGYRSILMTMQHLRSNVTYIPVISRPDKEPVPWNGASGYVQNVWKSGAIEKVWGFKPNPDNTHVFMCGSPQMSEEMLEILSQEGFKENRKNEPGQVHVEKYWQL